MSILLFLTLYLFIFRERGREGERERNINVWLSLMYPLLGTWPATQACALTGDGTGNPLVRRWASTEAHQPGPKFFLKDFIYLFLERGEGKEKERETSMCGCLSHTP